MYKLAVFASGTGSNFAAIAATCASGYLPAKITLVVVDNPAAEVIQKAKKLGIELFIFGANQYPDKSAYERQIIEKCRQAEVDLIVLAGYMRLLGPDILAAYPQRIINIHPSLLPAFKGRDAIGQAFAYGVKVMGVTIHHVNAEMDGGQIIAQRAFVVDPVDTRETVGAKVQAIEHTLYPETIKRLLGHLETSSAAAGTSEKRE